MTDAELIALAPQAMWELRNADRFDSAQVVSDMADRIEELISENARLTDWGRATFEAGFQATKRAEHSESVAAKLEDAIGQMGKELTATRAADEGHRASHGAIYLALGTDEPDRDRWPELIRALRAERDALKHDIARHIKIAADLATENEGLRKDAER